MSNLRLVISEEVIMHGIARVLSGENSFHAELRMARNRVPVLRSEEGPKPLQLQARLVGGVIDVMQFESGGSVYTLFGCRTNYEECYPEFVLTGQHETSAAELRLRKVRCYVDDVRSWFLVGGATKVTEAGLEYQSGFRSVTAMTIGDQVQMSVSVRNSVTLSHESDRKVLDERVWIDCLFEDNGINLKKVPELAGDIRTLLTCLIGFPVVVDTVITFFSDEESSRGHFVYYATYVTPREFDGAHFGLISYRSLQDKDLWERVVGNYFRSGAGMRKAWGGLYGLLTYDDIWDFKILGVVAALEKYAKTHVRVSTVTVEPAIRKRAKGALREALQQVWSQYRDTEQYTKDHERVLDQTLDAINHYRCEASHSLMDWTAATLDRIDTKVRTVLDFAPGDLALLKGLRDRIAHGADLELDQQTVGKVATLESKVILLLLYLANHELGVTDMDFIRNLHRSLNQYRTNSGLNNVALDRYSEDVTFVVIDQHAVDVVKERRYHSVVLERESAEMVLRLNKEKTEAFQDYHLDLKGFRTLTDYVRSLYGGDETLTIEFRGSGYLETRDHAELAKVHVIVEV